MRDLEFKIWLKNSYRTQKGKSLENRPQSDAISRCKRVDKYEGDLDTHFRDDGMKSLLEKLVYTKEDEDKKNLQKHYIDIDGNIRNGTASLRNAVKIYRQFCLNYTINI